MANLSTFGEGKFGGKANISKAIQILASVSTLINDEGNYYGSQFHF